MAKYSYEDKDSLRKELRTLINETAGKNETAETFSYTDTLLDITGSLGCWGIARVDKNGRLIGR